MSYIYFESKLEMFDSFANYRRGDRKISGFISFKADLPVHITHENKLNADAYKLINRSETCIHVSFM